jgi:hypothetical protein
MTDYERGVEAADQAAAAYQVQGTMTDRAKVLIGRRAVAAFLACQPEVWWCEEHTTSSKRSGFCVMYAYLVADEFPAELRECAMVKARLVATP